MDQPHSRFPTTLTRISIPPASCTPEHRIASYCNQFRGIDPRVSLPLRRLNESFRRIRDILPNAGVSRIETANKYDVDLINPNLRPFSAALRIMRMRLGLEAELPELFVRKMAVQSGLREARILMPELCTRRFPEPFAAWAYNGFIDLVHIEGFLYSVGRDNDAAKVGHVRELYKEGNFPFAYDKSIFKVYIFCGKSPLANVRGE